MRAKRLTFMIRLPFAVTEGLNAGLNGGQLREENAYIAPKDLGSGRCLCAAMPHERAPENAGSRVGYFARRNLHPSRTRQRRSSERPRTRL